MMVIDSIRDGSIVSLVYQGTTGWIHAMSSKVL
jgi:hypothetical protein